MHTQTLTKPPYRIRKVWNEWHVGKWEVHNGKEVLAFVGAFTHWAIAMAIVDADAGPNDYPLFRGLDDCS